MGNCMARKAVMVGEDEKKKKNEAPIRDEGKSEEECRKSSTKEGTKQKKAVRFRVDDEEERRKLGVVRIRLVVTREELRQILNGEDSGYSTSSEELLAAIKLGSRRRRTSSRIRMDDQRFSSSDGDMESRKWRPALESIPEF
ncbi:uncharacterized protein LOC116011273 [Ipomoea triloba]|uniref:uncharacterized protein LOC116011273 n=1 Tax=Ipomoea triloba TaxID=35885 RepID=UPI00125D7B3B|nr:uncharacterized protein LOC116011273 [Ipomoea triloba]